MKTIQAWIAIVWLLGCGALQAQYVPGTTNLVQAAGVSGGNYWLYLPSTYNTNSPPPLVLYFDPGGTGLRGIEKMQSGCEAAGWVLACANVLQNRSLPNEGPGDQLMEREVMDDVRHRICHDRARFYLSGFSGGAGRANSIAREHWNEATGLLLYGTWIEDYEDYTRFPDRLAVARVNGLDDIAAIQGEERDLAFYTQSLVRVHDIHFEGGHEIGPSDSILAAIAWLDADYASNGWKYIPSDFEAEATSLLSAAQAALDGGDYSAVVSHAVEVLFTYPMSGLTRQAEAMLLAVMTNRAMRLQAHYLPPAGKAWDVSWMLMERGLRTDLDFPPSYGQTYFETAVWACPTNARALAEAAYTIALDPARSRRDWQQAAAWADLAHQLRPDIWFTSFAQGAVYGRIGHIPSALSHYETAYATVMDTNLFPYYNGSLQRSTAQEAVQQYQQYAGQIQCPPLLEGGETLPENHAVHGFRGWMTLCGAAMNRNESAHTGFSALSFTGTETIVFLNAIPLTNRTVWMDAYLRPGRASHELDPPILPAATALFHVNSNGLLRVYDGLDGTSNWITLAHDPLPTQAWSRITIQMDFPSQKWAILLNDLLLRDDLGFARDATVFSGLEFIHDGPTPTFVDSLTITTAMPKPDTDRDGMPDEWESAFGLKPDDPSDAALDPDDDMYANYEEFGLQFDPWYSNPPPNSAFSAIQVTGNIAPWTSLRRTNSLYRHHRWNADLLVVASNSLEFHFTGTKTQNYSSVYWGQSALQADAPCLAGLAERTDLDSLVPFTLSGPRNGLYHFSLDEQSGDFEVRSLGLHDLDGDLMADEWEQYYFGSDSGAAPYGNPDHDAYPTTDEYFRNSNPISYDDYSLFTNIAAIGSFNYWDLDYASHASRRVADHLWQSSVWCAAGRQEFKWAANGSWAINWGDNDQPTTNLPFGGKAELQGSDIVLNIPVSGSRIISFDELSAMYALTDPDHDLDRDGMDDQWESLYFDHPAACSILGNPDGDGRINLAEYVNGSNPLVFDGWLSSRERMAVAGNFNGWNCATNNMYLLGNHWWGLKMSFTNQADAQFKMVANGTWDLAWGAPQSAPALLPLQALGNAQAGAPNFRLTEPLDGTYLFTFNDLSGLCTLDYAPDYIYCRPMDLLTITTNHFAILSWISSSDQFYALHAQTNPLAADTPLIEHIRATPPLNVLTQALPTQASMCIFQIRLE